MRELGACQTGVVIAFDQDAASCPRRVLRGHDDGYVNVYSSFFILNLMTSHLKDQIYRI